MNVLKKEDDGWLTATSEQVSAGVAVLFASGQVRSTIDRWAATELVRDILEAALNPVAATRSNIAEAPHPAPQSFER